MHRKKACLIINPRAGQNLAKLGDILAVFSAAGWSTKICLKEYSTHVMELATQAAEEGCDLVIAYGGDGTLNKVINGVMNAKGQHSVVGIIPGGTANQWASEIGVPADPVKAALALINSEVRKIDLGRVEVQGLAFPDTMQDNHEGAPLVTSKRASQRKAKVLPEARHYFLLTTGLGIDAAVIGHVSRPLKYRIGRLAFGLAAVQQLPDQHPFPIEVRVKGRRHENDVHWAAEALQVLIGNTRKYADVVELTPNAYIDDGILDVCVITAGTPLTTVQQATSLLLRRKPDDMTAEYFHGAHISMSIPASIDIHLDGSAVKLKDYLSKFEREALERTGDVDQVMVNYRFDAMPRALKVAIPSTYVGTLFEDPLDKDESNAPIDVGAKFISPAPLETNLGTSLIEPAQSDKKAGEEQHELTEQAEMLLHLGRRITIIGVVQDPGRKSTYIVAGGTPKLRTGEICPVALRIDGNTTIHRHTGEIIPPEAIQELREGMEIVVDGKKSKRSVIWAKDVILLTE